MNNINEKKRVKNEFEKRAMRVSIVSITGNVVLAFFKLIAGLLANSGAMISDAVHSASDVFSTIIVIIGIKLAGKESDKEHPYGHERLECVAATILATILCMTGIFIGYNAIVDIIKRDYDSIAIPGILAIFAAAISIVTKEAMYWYTRNNAKKIDSPALMADAWHHRSDALSSVGALAGIWAARNGYPIMDAVASLGICVLIVKASFDIYMDAIDKLVDKSSDEEIENDIRAVVLTVDGVLGVDLLTTRMFGNKIYVDLEICADGNMTLRESHDIAERVHDRIETDFPKVKHIMVHVNPN